MADKFQLKAIISAVDKLTPVLKGITRTTRIAHKALRDIGSAGRNLVSSLGLPAGLAFGMFTAGAISATRHVLDLGGALQDTIERTGVAADMLQALRAEGETMGIAAEETDKSLAKLNDRLAKAAMGEDKGLAGLLRRLHVPLRNTRGEIVKLEEALPGIAEGFKRNTNAAVRQRMASELFGEKLGTKLIPLLAKGKDGLAELRIEMERLGKIISKESIARLDALGDSFAGLKTQITAQLATAVAGLEPVLSPLLKQFSEWIAANKEIIQQRISQVVTKLTIALQNFDWEGFAASLEKGWNAVATLVDWMGGAENVAIAFGLAFLAGPVASVLAIVAALGRVGLAIAGALKAIGLAMLMNPALLAITALILAIGAAAWYVYKNWEPIKKWFIGVWDSICEAFTTAWNTIRDTFSSVKNSISQGLWGLFSDVMGVYRRIAAIVPDFLGGDELRARLDAAIKIAEENAGRSKSTADAAAGATPTAKAEIDVNFNNAPPGTRVDEPKNDSPRILALNPQVGYRMAHARGPGGLD